MLLAINPENPQLRLIQQVVQHLRDGAIICYPTDTGYGVGCDLFHQKAIKRLMQIKQRPEGKPFSFMCSSLKNISEYAHVSNTAYRLMKHNLPGAYTFVLPGTKLVPKIMASKQRTVGIRVPAHPICLLLLKTLGNPVVNTSLPVPPDAAPPTEAYEIEMLLGSRVELIIDGGPTLTDPSSLIDLTGDQPVVLRQGKGDIAGFLS